MINIYCKEYRKLLENVIYNYHGNTERFLVLVAEKKCDGELLMRSNFPVRNNPYAVSVLIRHFNRYKDEYSEAMICEIVQEDSKLRVQNIFKEPVLEILSCFCTDWIHPKSDNIKEIIKSKKYYFLKNCLEKELV